MTARLVPTAADQTKTATCVEDSAGEPALPPPPNRLSAPLQRRDPDRYEMLGEHGRGGLGTVTRAHDKELGRNVAIKELIKRGDAGEVRFLREAMITARLEHPGIVPVHEAGQWPDGTPFYVMKLVAGRSLKEAIARCSSIACRMALLHHVVAVADAVAYAHKRKIIHRDLKPANVIVGDFGETVVIDWGLAKDLSDCDDGSPADDRSPYRAPVLDDLTQAGSVLGTPMYMAPEQWRGERVDQRADVFAIGAMLWELCSQHRVPPAEPRLRDKLLRRANIDADLVAIIGKALAADPAARYQNAGELASDLRAFTSGARIASRRYSPVGVAVHWIRHHRAVAAISAAALVLAVVGATVYVRDIGVQRDAAEFANAELVLQNAELLMQRDPTAAVDALATYRGKDEVRKDRLLAEARGRGIAEARFTPHGDSVHFLHREADGSVFSLGEDRHLIVTRNGTSTALATDVATNIAFDFAPTRRLLAYGASPVGVNVLDLATRRIARLGTMHATRIAISDDGSLLAVLDVEQELTVWRLPQQQLMFRHELLADATEMELYLSATTLAVRESRGVRTFDLASATPTIATWSGGVAAFDERGGMVAVGDVQGKITLLGPALAPRGELAACRESVTSIQLAADHRVVFGCSDGRAGVVRFGHGTPTVELSTVLPGRVPRAELDPTGRRMVSVVSPSQIAVSDLETKLTTTFRGQPAILTTIAVTDDRILSGDGDGNIRVWRLPGSPAKVAVPPAGKPVFGVAISPDSKIIATDGSSGIVRRLDVTTGTLDDLSGHRDLVFRTRFAADGKTFLSVSFDGTVRVWDPRMTSPVRVFAGHRGKIGDAEYTARGDRIISTGDDGQVLAWSPRGTDVKVLYAHGLPLGGNEVLATNDHVVVYDSENVVLDVAPDGTARPITSKSADSIMVVRASPDGRFIAVGRASGAVTVYDTTDYRVVHASTSTAKSAVHQIQFEPTNRDVAVQLDSGVVRIIALDGKRDLPWRELAMRARDVSYSPDGETLGVICSDGTWLYSIAGDRWTFAQDHGPTPTSGRFTPNGKHFVSTDASGVVVVRELTPTPPRRLP